VTRPWYGPSRAVQSHRVGTARLFTRNTVPQGGHCMPFHAQYSPTRWALHAFSCAVQSHRVGTARLFMRSTVPQGGHCTPFHAQYSPTGWALHASSRAVQSHRVGTARLFTEQRHDLTVSVPTVTTTLPVRASYPPRRTAQHCFTT
jgi:hypothetical protein